MKYYRIFVVMSVVLLGLITGCGPKPAPQKSLLDTPENHYNQGMRELDKGNLEDAADEFGRATALDPDYPGGYVGMGLVWAEKGDFKEALNSVDKGIKKDKDRPASYVAKGRILTTQKKGDEWIEDAVKPFEKALDLDPDNEEALFYLGLAYKEAFQFASAVSSFSQVVAQKKDFAGRANREWELVQKIIRAAPGTRIGKEIALMPEIDRSDLAVLFIEELKLVEVLKRYQPQTYDTEFRPPSESDGANDNADTLPEDVENHWAKNWIKDVLAAGAMDLFPDGNFGPDVAVTRANYARFIQNIIVAVSGDQSLKTKYVGSESRFPDVNASHYAYNAICLAVDRGVMQADTIRGTFRMSDTVSGADALLIVRKLQNALRMTF